jgi:hypothetical protein
LEEANLSDQYLEAFKKLWADFDDKACGLIKVTDLVKLLAKIELPFDCCSMNMAMMKMFLPII